MTPRRRKARKQGKFNTKVKKRWFGHLFMAPCYYCKKAFMLDDLTIEHITPLCLGGGNERENITLACAPCNHERGREAWFQRKKTQQYLETKKYYEQYYSQHRDKDRSSPIQDP
jgi:HNH endonuclease